MSNVKKAGAPKKPQAKKKKKFFFSAGKIRLKSFIKKSDFLAHRHL